jgi:hypothetical protein
MRVLRAISLGAALWLLCGCNSLLGIEQLQHGAELDAGRGDAGALSETQLEAGAGGSSGRRALPGAAGSEGPGAINSGGGGKPSSNTGSGGAGGKPSEPVAGSGGRAGGTTPSTGGMGGTGGAAGAAPSGPGAVHGRVIDFRRNPVPGTPVRIGDSRTQTDADGRFSIDAVPSSYDVTLSIRTTVNNSPSRGAWQVQGLTRRDPTIQVYRALPSQTANALFKANNVTFPLRPEQRLSVSWASPLGEFQTDLSSQAGTITDVSWTGAQTSAGNAHALLYNVYTSPGTPSGYSAHDTHPISLQDGATDVPVDFDLAAQSIPADMLSGTLSGPRDNRVLHFFLRFSDDTSMALPPLYPKQDTFTFLAPKIAGSTLTLLFENSNNGLASGLSAVFVDRVMPGQSDIALKLPVIPTLTSPAFDKQNVGPDTEFEWSGDAKVYLLCAESANYYENACVLTNNAKARLPVSPRSDYVPSAGEAFNWTVETHGSWNSVDEASGEGGVLSAGYRLSSMPQVPRGPGSYSTSAIWVFTTPP